MKPDARHRMYAMNMFRILGDILHLLSFVVLIHKMRRQRSCAGKVPSDLPFLTRRYFPQDTNALPDCLCVSLLRFALESLLYFVVPCLPRSDEVNFHWSHCHCHLLHFHQVQEHLQQRGRQLSFPLASPTLLLVGSCR